jgi:hypothetical protein
MEGLRLLEPPMTFVIAGMASFLYGRCPIFAPDGMLKRKVIRSTLGD